MSKYTGSGCLFLNQIQKKGSLLLAKENMFLQKKESKKNRKIFLFGEHDDSYSKSESDILLFLCWRSTLKS